MHLIEIFLPLYDNAGQPQPRELFADVRRELIERFGGLTAHSQAPAEGVWQDDDAGVTRDEIVILEVMAEEIDEPWWRQFRQDLERRFRQESIVIRAQSIRML